MRLWLRLAIVMTLVAVAPLAVTGIRAMSIATETAESRAEDERLQDAQSRATFLATWLAGQGEFLAGWSELYPSLGQHSDEHRVGFLRSAYRAMPEVVVVALVDSDGVALVDPVFLGDEAASLDHEPATEARAAEMLGRVPLPDTAGGTVLVGSPWTAPDAQGPSVPISVRAGPDAVLAADVSLASPSVALTTSSRREVVLLGPDRQPVLGAEARLLDLDRMAAVPAGSDLFDYRLEGGRRALGAMATVPGTDWTVVVLEPRSAVAEASRRIEVDLFSLLAISLCAAAVLALFMSRQVSRPVLDLKEAADRVADGQLGHVVEVPGSDELGQLAESFNRMSLRLDENQREIEAQRREIEAYNEELEQRVEDRTRELRDAQQRLVQSGQLAAVAEVGAGLAHELNNPLAGILGLAQVLRVKHPEEPMLSQIETEAVRCREVVDAMLRFSEGAVDPSESPVIDLVGVVTEVLGLVAGRFRQRGVEVDWRAPEAPLHVRVDPVLASRILAPVLNSMRAGLEDGARLTIRAERTGDEVALLLEPDRAVAVGRAADDWKASGMALWVARKMLVQAGGRVDEPTAPSRTWRVVFPGA